MPCQPFVILNACLHRQVVIWLLGMIAVIFFIPSIGNAAENPPQEIIEIGKFCFRNSECVSYDAKPSPFPDPACKNPGPDHNAAAVKHQYLYNCLANSPKVNLQVSIGGYQVQGIEQYIQRLYIALVSLAGLVAGIMYVWAGVKWLTSAGAPDRITDAKKKIGNASLGLILVLSSYVILQTVNPALVTLKLPGVKIVRRNLKEINEWCVNREPFKCGGDEAHPDGQWACSDPAYVGTNPPCGQPKGGKCYGQLCASGGCQRIIMDRLVSLNLRVAAENELEEITRKCFDPADCNNCDVGPLIGPPTAEEYAQGDRDDTLHIDKVALCISTACNCIAIGDNIGDATPDPFRCSQRLAAGEYCNDDQACESDICNSSGILVDNCAEEGGDPDGTTCNRDIECQSGWCNPVGGLVTGKCYTRPGPKDMPCEKDSDCQSRDCGTVLLPDFVGQATGAALCR